MWVNWVIIKSGCIIFIQISIKFIPKGRIVHNSKLVQVVKWTELTVTKFLKLWFSSSPYRILAWSLTMKLNGEEPH